TGGLPWIDAVTRGFTEEIKDSIVYVLFRWLTVFGSKPVMVPFVIGMMIVIWCIYRAWRQAFTYGLVIVGTEIVNKNSTLVGARRYKIVLFMCYSGGLRYLVRDLLWYPLSLE